MFVRKIFSLFLSVLMILTVCMNTSAKTHVVKKTEAFDLRDNLGSRFFQSDYKLNNYEDAKSKIISSLDNIETYIDIYSYNISVDEVFDLYRDVISENPRFFYGNCSIYVSYEEYNRAWDIEIVYEQSKEEIKKMRKFYDVAFEKAVEECFSSDMTDLEKVISAHNYIVLNTKYDFATYNDVVYNGGKGSFNSFNAYGVFVNKEAVCAGYAFAFNALMKYAGIESVYINSDNMNHAWNMVFLNDKWYHVDSTWDDPGFSLTDDNDMEGYVSRDFLLVSDSVISDDEHQHYDWDFDAPKAEDNRYLYNFFKNIDTGMFYYDGRWYYGTDYFYGGNLVSNVFDGSDEKIIDVGNLKVYAIAKKDNYLYFSASDKDAYKAKYIYKYDLETNVFECIADFSGTETEIMELSVDGSTLRYVQYNSTGYRLIKINIGKRIENMLDISKSHWAYNAIDFCMEKSIFSGKDDNTFCLDENMTRAQFCQMIYNYMFSDEEADYLYNSFDDVKESDWFYKAVNVCYKNGIIKGDGKNFNPDEAIKREDASLIMMRIKIGEDAIKAYNTEEKLQNLNNENKYYNDLSSISDYAYNAMIASLGEIFNGDENGNINPLNSITRAQCAQMMYNYLQN